MRRLRGFVAFVDDFIVGGDPLIAVAVVVALGALAGITGVGVNAWWLLPAVAVGVLGLSLARATRP